MAGDGGEVAYVGDVRVVCGHLEQLLHAEWEHGACAAQEGEQLAGPSAEEEDHQVPAGPRRVGGRRAIQRHC